jgi:MoxR-like ATPase
MDRFAFILRLDYLTASQEARVLKQRTGAPDQLCKDTAAMMVQCRAKASAGHLPSAPSMRNAVAFIVAVYHGVRPADAWEASVTARAAPEAQEELRALFVAHWPTRIAPSAAPAPETNAAQPFGTVDHQPTEGQSNV